MEPASLGNISTRLNVGTGDNVLIGGFIITGNAPKKIIIRGLGTSLQDTFPDTLANPFLELRDASGNVLQTNDNWQTGDRKAILATGLAPTENLEAAIVVTLPPDLYTAILRGVNDTTGMGLIEIYDLDSNSDSALSNLSTRGFVSTGDNVLIGGLIVQGSSDDDVVLRAIGPSLGIARALQDPVLQLYDGQGNLIEVNDNWRTNQAKLAGTNLAPSNEAESAIVATLSPGLYTAVVRGANDTSGVALVESYQLKSK